MRRGKYSPSFRSRIIRFVFETCLLYFKLIILTIKNRCTRVTFDENMIAAATFGQVVQLWDFTATT